MSPGLAGGEDVGRTRVALEGLGVEVVVDGDAIVVNGRGVDAFTPAEAAIDCGNSGTSIRLLAGLLAGRPFRSVLTGDESLVQRPMARVIEPLRAMGARVDGDADGTRPPLIVHGGDLVGCEHRLAVASAQVKTALLLAGLQARGTTEVTEPAPSRDHTERMLGALGAPLVRVDEHAVRVTAGAPNPFEFTVPGDPSSAAFWVVAATIVEGSELTIEDVAVNPSRIAFVDVLQRMGASIEMVTTGERLGEPVGELRIVSAALHGTTVEGAEIPCVIDEIPVLAVAAAFADGVTEFRDAAELRVKESDRIATVSELLTRVGVGSEQGADHLVVRGGRPGGGGVREPRRPPGGDGRRGRRPRDRGRDDASAVGARSATSYPEFTARPRVARPGRGAEGRRHRRSRRLGQVDGCPRRGGRARLPDARHRRDVPSGRLGRARGAGRSGRRRRGRPVARDAGSRSSRCVHHGSTVVTCRTRSAAPRSPTRCRRCRPTRRCGRCSSTVNEPGSTNTAAEWSRVVTSAPSCCPTRRSRCSSPRATTCARLAASATKTAAQRVVEVDDVRSSLDRRDRADGTLGRATRPEDAAPDAVVIDTSDVTADVVIADLVARAERAFAAS